MALLTSVCLGGVSATASAQDFDGIWDKERWQLRGRLITIHADGDGKETVTGSKTDVEHSYVPEFDVTFFFTKNIAAELIAATANHTIRAGTNTLGDAWILPPTLTLQYHFQPDSKFSPYVGAGLNYSMFFNEDDNSADGFNNLEVDGGFGYAVQAGFDYWLSDHWGFNADVKYINLDVDVTVNSGATALSAPNVDLDPWIFGVGTSYRF